MNEASRSRIGWLILRIHLAGLVAAHGYYRLLTGGTVGFGEYLQSQNLPYGLAIAWAITLAEVVGSLLLAAGKLVFPVAVLLSGIYLVGIFMVHAQNGWFVVGAGRNGAEYSVLLIVALLCMGLQHLPVRKGARA